MNNKTNKYQDLMFLVLVIIMIFIIIIGIVSLFNDTFSNLLNAMFSLAFLALAANNVLVMKKKYMTIAYVIASLYFIGVIFI